jgi:NAD(P)-dependent dehydrogenase (short-subunit alcohol dehydrogenase family)
VTERIPKLVGRSAVVTGGSRGIGLAIARKLSDAGVNVFICARDETTLTQTINELRQKRTTEVYGAQCDVRDAKSVRLMFSEVEQRFGRLDILVNNAGIGSKSYVEQMSEEEWNATIETNLSGVFHCCNAAIPLIKQAGGGSIINIGSLAGTSAFPGGSAYCASKYGLIGFSESLMQELRYDHIKVSCIMPGSVNTGFGRGGEYDAQATWKLDPYDVAEAVIYVLSSDSRALPSRLELRPSEPRK